MTTPSIDKIIAFENGDLDGHEVIDLFAELIETGLAWTLQGSYGRTARDLIEAGLINEDGTVPEGTWDLAEELSA